jgi:hypothetical protein
MLAERAGVKEHEVSISPGRGADITRKETVSNNKC